MAATASNSPKNRSWPVQLVRNLLLWILPVVALWVLFTPFYNRFLALAGERLTRAGEFPAATRLFIQDTHEVLVTRSDLSGKDGFVYRFRITDLHFNLILTISLFLAVPAVESRRRAENLGWALLISVLFHILVLFFYVKFVYSTQLGAWSNEHYGPVARNLWGFGKHLLDLPFKLALPFMLWAGFYFPDFQRHRHRG
ncbi:MAG: hypothetical protein ABIV06_14020 [Thermoanaerobaculia bacterium]